MHFYICLNLVDIYDTIKCNGAFKIRNEDNNMLMGFNLTLSIL